MRLERERASGRSRWSIETTGAIDRALAAWISVSALVLGHVFGLDASLWKLVGGLF